MQLLTAAVGLSVAMICSRGPKQDATIEHHEQGQLHCDVPRHTFRVDAVVPSGNRKGKGKGREQHVIQLTLLSGFPVQEFLSEVAEQDCSMFAHPSLINCTFHPS